MFISDALKELRYSKNIFYGDEIYILPYHMITENNSFNDLKKVIVTSVVTEGSNRNGCEVTGKVITYDSDSFPVENFYSGHAIYRVNGSKVVTQDGEKYPAYNMALDKMELVDEKFKKLYYRFKASDNLYVDVAVGGDCKFKSHNEAIRLLKCLDIRMCLLYSDRLEYYMNGTKVISTKYEVVHGEDIFDTPKAREELWEHMVCNEIPYHQNVYKMNFSKVFLLSKERFLIR